MDHEAPLMVEPDAHDDVDFWSGCEGREGTSTTLHPSFDLVSEERLSEILASVELIDEDITQDSGMGTYQHPQLTLVPCLQNYAVGVSAWQWWMNCVLEGVTGSLTLSLCPLGRWGRTGDGERGCSNGAQYSGTRCIECSRCCAYTWRRSCFCNVVHAAKGSMD